MCAFKFKNDLFKVMEMHAIIGKINKSIKKMENNNMMEFTAPYLEINHLNLNLQLFYT